MNNNSIDTNDEIQDTKKIVYHCKYCRKSMSKYDYETYHGLCGKCREIVEWKDILRTVKEK